MCGQGVNCWWDLLQRLTFTPKTASKTHRDLPTSSLSAGHAGGEAQQSPAPSLWDVTLPTQHPDPGSTQGPGVLQERTFRHEKGSTLLLPGVVPAHYQLKPALSEDANAAWRAGADQGSHPVSVGEGPDLLISLSHLVGNLN